MAWPGWSHLGDAARLGLLAGAWFGLIYGGAYWVTANRSLRLPLQLDLELHIPFVPGMAVVYMSIYLLFLASPFVLRTRDELRAYAFTFAVVTLFAGICFLLFPAEVAYGHSTELGAWAVPFRIADRLNLDYNNVPSLHVAFSVLCIALFASRAGRPGGALLWMWATALSLSTLLTHQHHVLDVVTGWILGIVAARGFYPRFCSGHPPFLCGVTLRASSFRRARLRNT